MSPDLTDAAETALLADCILNPGIIRQTADIITPDDFSNPTLGVLYGLIAGMVSAYGAAEVNGLSIAREVERRRHSEAQKPAHKQIRFPDVKELGSIVTGGQYGLPATHARLIRESSVRRQILRFALRLAQDAETGADAAALAVAAVEQAKQIRDGYRAGTLAALPLGEVMDAAADTYDWLVDGILERGDRLILTGGEGAGKSTLTRQLAVCLAAGVHPFRASPMAARRVLYVDCENSERQWRRTTRGMLIAASRLGTGEARENLRLRCMRRMDITSASDLGAVHGMVDDVDPALVVIGPLYRLVPRAITNDDDAAPVLAALDSLRDRGPALIVEAHAGHALGRGGERDYRPRGSAALMGWPEFGLGLAPNADAAAKVDVIRWRGDRDERDWPTVLRRNGELPWTDDRQELTWRERHPHLSAVAAADLQVAEGDR